MRRKRSRLALAIVGNTGGTNVGDSLRRAAISSGHQVLFFDSYDAIRGNRLLRDLSWHLLNRRPLRLAQFSAEVVAACATTARPDILIATGAAPLNERALRTLRAHGIICINYSTDDPWSPTQRAHWHLRALTAYDVVFTTRRANIDDLLRLGCTGVQYLPFGYDETLCTLPAGDIEVPTHDVLFVGGGDSDRAAFMAEFMRQGPPVALIGGYWERYSATRSYALGTRPAHMVCALTAAARVNLCLVRRANRDGHVMRSFEIPAIGGCMLIEDTNEHRAIFGEEGDTVLYFHSPQEAAARAQALIGDATLRARLTARARCRIRSQPNRYADRLQAMLQYCTASALRLPLGTTGRQR
jgi:spore maturation protein CgeB